MMNSTWKSPDYKIVPGTTVVGKWHKNRYSIIKTLGYGATGHVYLANCTNGEQVALKISDNSLSITSEVNVLRHFEKVQGFALGPSLIDVDDWEIMHGKSISFYVMEYVRGESFLTFINQRGQEWIGILILQLLSDLHILHKEGWVFGDLKPDNLMISLHPPKVRMLDVGGTTLKGRSVKEFTEFFDRGYWGLGTRRAEESYDLFSVAMIMINAAYPNRFEKDGRGVLQLKEKIKHHPFLLAHEKFLTSALNGNFVNALQMKEALAKSLSNAPRNKEKITKVTKTQTVTSRVARRNQRKTKKFIKRFSETIVLVAVVCMIYFLYVYSHLL
ncbi:protein kinase domain-containing protein [Sutcliffiella sp. NC1]|uniref:protein kinase domain-containing protein n=1 Tax=Sutcliffiella sp. NC1 TaxID=3004096 RepID=UPI0022DDC53E|nr:protein kinase family protein [Sutcliffiella sp. NC1]WBL15199.1 protein kinase family protein [Sutcliffiella sp. NC1]